MSRGSEVLSALYNIVRPGPPDPFYAKKESRIRDEFWVEQVFRLLNLLKDSKLPKLKDFNSDRAVIISDLTTNATGWINGERYSKTLTGKGWTACISVLMALRALSTDDPFDKNCLLARCNRLKTHARDHLGDARRADMFQEYHNFFKQNKIGMLVTQKLEYLDRCMETERPPELMEEMMTRLPCKPGHHSLQKQDEDEFEVLARDILFGDEDKKDDNDDDRDFGPVHQGTPPGKALTAEPEAVQTPFVNTVIGEAANPIVGNPFLQPFKPDEESDEESDENYIEEWPKAYDRYILARNIAMGHPRIDVPQDLIDFRILADMYEFKDYKSLNECAADLEELVRCAYAEHEGSPSVRPPKEKDEESLPPNADDSDSETGSDNEPPAEELPVVPMPTPMPSFDSHQAKRQRTYYEAKRQVSKQLEGAVQKAMAEFLGPNDPEPGDDFDEAEVQAVCFRALQVGRNHIEEEIVKLLGKRM